MRNHRQRMRMQKLRVLDKKVSENISFDQADLRVTKSAVINVHGFVRKPVHIAHQRAWRSQGKIVIFKMLIRKREDTKPAEDQSDFSCVTAVKNRTALLEAKIPPVLIEELLYSLIDLRMDPRQLAKNLSHDHLPSVSD